MARHNRILSLCFGLALFFGNAFEIGLPSGQKTPGGEFLYDANPDTFSHPAPALNARQRNIFNLGNRIFNTNWTATSAVNRGFDGLGPPLH